MADKDDTRPKAEDSPPIDLRALFGAMSDAVLIISREGRWLWAAPTLAYQSPVAKQRLDFLIGKTFEQVEPSLADKLRAAVHAALDTGETQQIEYGVTREDLTIWFAAAVSRIDDDRVVWVARDVTERVLMRQGLEERVEERTRNLETLLDVSRTVSSTLDVQEVLGLLLDQAKALIPYNGASVNLLEGEDLVVLDARSPNDDYRIGARFPVRTRDKSSSKSMWARLARGEAVIIKDMKDMSDPTAVSYTRYAVAAGDNSAQALERIRSWMVVPLMHRGNIVGTLSMSRPEPDFFTEEHSRLAMAVAGQAAVAIQNAKLFEQREERTRELGVLLDVSRELTAIRGLRQLAETMMEQIKRVIDYTGGSVLVIEEDSIRFIQSVGPERVEEEQEGVRFPLDLENELVKMVMEGRHVIIENVRGEGQAAADYRALLGGNLDQPAYTYIRGWMAIPLRLEGRVIGLMSLSKDVPGYFTEHHVELATAIARHAAVAADNATLMEETQRQTREMGALLEISRALSSTLDLQHLLELMLDQLRSLVYYEGAGISLITGDKIEQLAVRRPEGYQDMPGTGVETTNEAFGAEWERVNRGDAINIDDVWDDSLPAQLFRRSWGGDLRGTAVEYIHSMMVVPLITREQVIGTLNLAHSEPAHYKQEHIELVKAVAGQAAAAIQNARLYEQTQRRTAELGALLEVSRALSSTLELQPLLELMLDELKSVVGYEGAGILLAVPGGLRQFAVRRPEKYIEMSEDEGVERLWEEGGPAWRRAALGKPVVVDDVLGDSVPAQNFRRAWSGRDDLEGTPAEYARSLLTVPLMLRDQLIGAFTLAHSEPGYYKREHIELIQTVAGPAAAAIENAHLFEQTQQRTREMSALLEVSKAAVSTLDVGQIMTVILDQLKGIIDHSGSAIVLKEGADLVVVDARAAGGNAADIGGRIPLATSGPNIWTTVSQGEPVIIGDIGGDEPMAVAYREAMGAIGLTEKALSLIRSWMGVPLTLSDEVIGMLTLSWVEPNHFTSEHARLVTAFANQAAAAVEHARSFSQGQRLAAVEERQRLARELHDSVSQALYGIALGARTARTVLDRDPVKAIEPVEYVLSLAEAGLAEMRALIFELRPESLETEGVVAAINKQIAATSARYSLNIESELCEEPSVSLPAKEAIYRIAQEALHNIVKHAGATDVRLTLAQSNGWLSLTIADNGAGFDASGEFPGHLGLRSMRERALGVGGELSVESSPGSGTTVTAKLAAAT